MPKFNIKNNDELNNHIDMLEGNIVRIKLTDDYSDLVNHYKFAIARIDAIYEYRKNYELDDKPF